jgi:hypothetical protein
LWRGVGVDRIALRRWSWVLVLRAWLWLLMLAVLMVLACGACALVVLVARHLVMKRELRSPNSSRRVSTFESLGARVGGEQLYAAEV